MDAQTSPFRRWIRDHRVVLLFALLLLAVFAMRDLWAPDEPDFAQSVKEMRLRGAWLLPYLNGLPYNEKPILFYWLMKLCAIAGQALTGGAGFTQGIAAWALRLPSVIAAIAFLAGFHAWIRRFVQEDVADLAAMILISTPIWLWQAQFIQIDMLFAALLAWSWIAWFGGYLLLREHRPRKREGEEAWWFVNAYLSLALAVLAKGPLAVVLSVAVGAAFLAWQRDFSAIPRLRLGKGLLIMIAVLAPWYVAAAIKGGPAYAYAMIVHQNLERALHAWDHIQPWWRYAQYLTHDFFPWSLLLPALVFNIWREDHHRSVGIRFCTLAFAVPFLLLSCSQSKQSKYLLMVYPFLALLLASHMQPLAAGVAPQGRVRRLGSLMAAALWIPALVLVAVFFFHGFGHKVQDQIAPFLGPGRLGAIILLLGAVSISVWSWKGEGRYLVREAAVSITLLFLVLGTWGFKRLDPTKGYRAWTTAAEPLINGRQVYFWQTIRSGPMVYTDHLMPELRSFEELEAKLGPEDRLIAMDREWNQDAWGMTPERRARFEVLLRMPVGGGEVLLLRTQSKAFEPKEEEPRKAAAPPVRSGTGVPRPVTPAVPKPRAPIVPNPDASSAPSPGSNPP